MRLDMAGLDAAEFHQMRDQWRDAALATKKLPLIAYKLIPLVASYINRQLGYGYPRNQEDLADVLACSVPTVNRGIQALRRAGLIETVTVTKRAENRTSAGKNRRIWLTLPTERVNDQVASEVNDHRAAKVNDQTPVGVNGHVHDQSPEVNDQNRGGECSTVDHIYLTYTPDSQNGATKVSVSEYAHLPAREGNAGVYHGDDAFLDAFDRAVISLTKGRQIGAGEIGGIVQSAFDSAIASDRLMMPFDWGSVQRSARHAERQWAARWRSMEDWFTGRAGQLIHQRKAA